MVFIYVSFIPFLTLCVYLLKIVIGATMFYNVVLVSAIQQCDPAIYICVYIPSLQSFPPTPPTSHPSRSSQSASCVPHAIHTAASHQLVILHVVMCKYQCCSLNSSHTFHPRFVPTCPFSTCVTLHSSAFGGIE